ncbi:tetratricopeptide repeat protein [Selenomonas sp. oral taxon 137 str. F0430]|uniref:M48 family metallopeptidase n=1 Tax=Selenomonas sp. oral taxon 137 TaxID=712531 RepID=UPI0001EB2657|nr:M48 family metallopeptidase [Selenomonas sp. oral taxon 137]EFR41468.1 tetratricopeptide repeat protein [Selenomonas sp. oral taxon 137 str. F0430]
MRKKFSAALAVAVLAAGMFVPMPRAQAIDAWAIAAQALGVFGAYKSSLAAVLAMGNDVHAQVESKRQDLAEQGRAKNESDIHLVDGIMERLVEHGDYVLRANSLPFTWALTDSPVFNAACYPTDYVTINRGLVHGLNGNVDELAAVLGHEMTHGLRQHSAHNYAKAAAQYYGMAFLNMNTGLMDWGKMNALVNYSIAKNVTLPTEYEADEGGFRIMTSAGFNPGGGAAAMARMGYYLTYETQELQEYQDPTQKDLPQDDFSDHPATEKRENRLAQYMTDYSAGHVTVKDRKTVCIDGTPLFTVTWTDENYDNSPENAYLAAGALARAFHDFDAAEDWGLALTRDGGATLRGDARVNELLYYFLKTSHTGGQLRDLVQAAYAGEAASGAREKLRAEEQSRADARAKERAAVEAADAKAIEKMRENSDAYSDYGDTARALALMERVFASPNDKDRALSYVIRARAYAARGDAAAALQDADRGVAEGGKNVLTWVNRADVRRTLGDREGALADCMKAMEVDAKSPYAYLIAGELYDEMEDTAQAQTYFKKLYEVEPRAVARIPDTYLKDIDKKAYDKRIKEQKQAREEREKALREKNKKESKIKS